jgi:hypothetical protein
MAQVIEHLHHKYEALSLNQYYKKKGWGWGGKRLNINEKDQEGESY